MTIYNKILDLSKIIKHEDKPILIKNFASNPSQYISWVDVEDIINTHNLFVEIVKNGNKDDVPFAKYFWYDRFVQDKKYLFDSINSGNTFVITGYSSYKKSINDLLMKIESVFDVVCDAHVYGGLANTCQSFNAHVDIPSNIIIQVEGKTPWIVYKNYASDMFTQQDINKSVDESILVPDLEVTLEPGDMLYFPARRFHKAFPSEKRLSISIPCGSKKYHTTNKLINLDRTFYNINYE